MKVPNFFIVGAMKAGTTSLWAYLGQHPQIYMAPLKELYYFASEFRLENFAEEAQPKVAREMQALKEYLNGDMRETRMGGLVSDWSDYVKVFRNASDEIAVGEATPSYLWSKTAARNIAARLPHARIIVSLRNPVDRAFSQYLHLVTIGATRRTFRQQIEVDLADKGERLHSLMPLLEFGQYYEQVKRYLNEFPSSQIHISLYEDLAGAPGDLLAKLYAFLGVDSDFVADVSHRHKQPQIPRLIAAAYFLKRWGVWHSQQRLVPRFLVRPLRSVALRPRASMTMDRADRTFLRDYYREDLDKLGVLLGQNFSSWLTCESLDESPRPLEDIGQTSKPVRIPE